MRRAPASLALLLLAAAPARAGEAPTAERVAADVKAHEEQLARLREQATSVLDSLAAVEEEVRGLEGAAERAEYDAKYTAARVASAQKEEQAALEALLAELDTLSPRLRARYELARHGRANLLLSATSVGDLLRRQLALDQILSGDLELLGRARVAVERLQARRARLEEAKAEYAQRHQLAEERRDRARKRKEELGAMHDALLAQQDLKEKTLKELYRVQAELSDYVGDLRREARPTKLGFARRKGKMPFPAPGLIEVGFGKVLNPKFNTVTFQKGLDIRAPEGAPVTAVAAGKVVHAGPFRGYGNLVIVEHGEGYHSLYAHLGVLQQAVGDEVEEGTALGTVGDTGSLKGPYLYFEIRKKGKPVDPRDWLAAP